MAFPLRKFLKKHPSVARMLALPLKPFRRACIFRWLDVITLTATATLLLLAITHLWRPEQDRTIEAIAQLLTWFLVALGVALLGLACVPLRELGALRLRHVGSSILYPPTWLSPLAAPPIVAIVDEYFGTSFLNGARLADTVATVLIYAGGIIACLALGFVLGPERRRAQVSGGQQHVTPSAHIGQIGRHELFQWLVDESPVSDPDSDHFDLAPIAQRIAESFFEPELRSMGLIGPYGSGKSSVIRLVEYYLRRDRHFRMRMWRNWRKQFSNASFWRRHSPPTIITCTVGAWGLLNESCAVVVLRRAIACVSRYVDCLSVVSLPE